MRERLVATIFVDIEIAEGDMRFGHVRPYFYGRFEMRDRLFELALFAQGGPEGELSLREFRSKPHGFLKAGDCLASFSLVPQGIPKAEVRFRKLISNPNRPTVMRNRLVVTLLEAKDIAEYVMDGSVFGHDRKDFAIAGLRLRQFAARLVYPAEIEERENILCISIHRPRYQDRGILMIAALESQDAEQVQCRGVFGV